MLASLLSQQIKILIQSISLFTLVSYSDILCEKPNLFKGYPPSPRRWESPGNLLAVVAKREEFLKIRESCTDPGQPTRTSLKTILSSQTNCKGISFGQTVT